MIHLLEKKIKQNCLRKNIIVLKKKNGEPLSCYSMKFIFNLPDYLLTPGILS